MRNLPEVGRIMFVGPVAPRKQEVADFTTKLAEALNREHPKSQIGIIAIRDDGSDDAHPSCVGSEIRVGDKAGYRTAASEINPASTGVDVVSLQHSYGLFGGEDGEDVLGFLEALEVPVVTTLHEVPHSPSRHLVQTTAEIIRLSDRVVVSTDEDRQRLIGQYEIHPERVDVIPVQSTSDAMQNLGRRERSEAETGGALRGGDPSEGSRTISTDEDKAWSAIAEAYNRSYISAIRNPFDGKNRLARETWYPWVHDHELSISDGYEPGWAD